MDFDYTIKEFEEWKAQQKRKQKEKRGAYAPHRRFIVE